MVYSYEEAIKYILNIPKFTKKNPVENTRYFMECLGNPQDSFKTIHVAGTNGKGSVCAMLSAILVKAGKDTGLFTSPHLIDINERIRINGRMISDDEFVDMFHEVYSVSKNMLDMGYEHPTFFEFIYGMAMLNFKRQNVEYAVVEAGMGGLSDTTNIVKSPVVTVITTIGLDHTEYLGTTIEEIALQKAGIIKKGVPVVFCGNDKRALKVIRDEAGKHTDRYTFVDKDAYKIVKKENNYIDFLMLYGYYEYGVFRIPFIAEYQVFNAAIAISALEYIERLPYELVYDALKEVVWEGRMDEVLKGIIVDGAHNENGIYEFVKTVNQINTTGKKYLLFSAVRDKDYDKMIKIIAENTEFEQIFVTQIEGIRSLRADVIAKEFSKYTDTDIFVYEDIEEAFVRVCDTKEESDIVFCCGSLYLAGEIKRIIRRKYND